MEIHASSSNNSVILIFLLFFLDDKWMCARQESISFLVSRLEEIALQMILIHFLQFSAARKSESDGRVVAVAFLCSN